MAVAFSNRQIPQFEGQQRETVQTVTFDSSYPTGGESFRPNDVGLSAIDSVEMAISTTGYLIRWDGNRTSPKLMVFYGDYDNAADGPLIQIPNGTNLSTVVVSLRCKGR